MNQKAQISTQNDILSALSFPDKGDIVSGVKVIDTDTKIVDGNFRYRITLPKGTRRSDIPNILGSFYKTQMINIDGIDHVVEEHDYQTKPTRNSTVVSGSMVLTPLSNTNPMQKKLTALEDFDQEYTKMELMTPESYFNIYPYRGFNGPTFRNKLWSFVSTRGENYGYTDGKKMYYRRASLVMPKIKITKAPPEANMFYHTHPKKDEPSLSSPDDYLLYFDMSHKPLNIRHFYTVMADRMDHFHIVPKHSKKKDYVRISEDKFIEELDHQIDEAGKKLDEKMPNDTYQDDLHYCEKVTREVVKWLNKKYDKYFTITYKCYYKVKKNPDKPTGSDLHLDDELLAKPLNDIKSGKYSWPEFKTRDKPHEGYAYWHSRYFSQNRNMGGTGYMGLLPGDMRRLEHFLYAPYRGSNYSYDDILGILCLSYDIRVRDSKITDGKEFETRIEDILDYLEIKDDTIKEDIILFDSIAAADVYEENIAEMIGDHYFILPLAHFSFKSIEAMKDVKAGKRDFERAKYDIMVTEREKMSRKVAKALGELNNKLKYEIRAEEPDPETGEYEIIKPAEKVPVWGLDGEVMKDRINPPIQVKKIEYTAFLPTEIFENPTLVKEILEEWKKPGKDLLGVKNKFNIVVPYKETAVGMMISISTGNVQFFYPAADYVATEPQEEAVVATFRQLVEKLNSRGFEIPTEDIAIGEIEPMRNPKYGLLVSISGTVSPSKSKIIDSLAKRLDAKVATMYTTRALKAYEEKPSLVEVTDEIFDKMELNGDIVVVTLSAADGSKRGYSRKELFSEGTTIVDTELADIPFLIKSEPSVKSFYLHPTNTKAAVKDFMSEYVSPQEATRVSELAALGKIMVEAEVDNIIEYDIDKPGEAIEEIYVEIPKKNPGPIGSLYIPSGSDYYLRAQTIPINALQNVRRNPSKTNPPDGIVEKAIKSIKKSNLLGSGAFGSVFRIPDTGYVFKIYKVVDIEYYKKLTKWIGDFDRDGKPIPIGPKPTYPEHLKQGYKLNWGVKLDIGLPLYAVGEDTGEFPEVYNVIMEEIEGYTIADKIFRLPGKQHGKKFVAYNKHLKNLNKIPQSEFNRFVRDYKEAIKLGMHGDGHNGNMVLDPTKKRIVWLDFFWEQDERKFSDREKHPAQRIPIRPFEALTGISTWFDQQRLLTRSLNWFGDDMKDATPREKGLSKLKTRASIKKGVGIHIENTKLIKKVFKKFKKAMIENSVRWTGRTRFYTTLDDKSYERVVDKQLIIVPKIQKFYDTGKIEKRELDSDWQKDFNRTSFRREIDMEQLKPGYMPNPPVKLVSRVGTDDNVSRFFNKDTGKELTGKVFESGTIDTKDGASLEVGEETSPIELVGIKRQYNVAKLNDRAVIQVDNHTAQVFEKIDFKLPVHLEYDPMSLGEPSAFISTRGVLIFDKTEDNYTMVKRNEITDFKGVSKTDSTMLVPLYKYAKVVKRTPGRHGGPVENPQKKISIRIDESTNPEKKMMAVFTKPNGRTKTIHFGARGMSDYTQHKDKDRMKSYLARHGGMGEDWDDPMTAGALSRWILWGKPSLRESFNDYKKRFNLEGVMAVTNTKMNPGWRHGEQMENDPFADQDWEEDSNQY